MWDIVVNGCELPKILIEVAYQPKVKSPSTKEETKRYHIASKVKWIIINSHAPNEYERISNCTINKEVWQPWRLLI